MPGVFDHLEVLLEQDRCFVMMPFDPSFNAVYRIIERCCVEQGLRCERADSDASPGKITRRIYGCIRRSHIIIADMSGRNPNVFYELGLAHAISENVILLTQSREDVPFDLKDFLHIVYTNSMDGAERLVNDLAKALTSITRSASSMISSTAKGSDYQPVPFVEEATGLDDLGILHIQAEIARKKGDRATALTFTTRALDLARLGNGDASEVGNCAIEAEAAGLKSQARELYELALAVDPRHVNNRQCYVSFLLDAYSKESKAILQAAAILATLESTSERQERTRALRAQYLSITGKAGDKEADTAVLVAELIADGMQSNTLTLAASALKALSELGQHQAFREIIIHLQDKASAEDVVVLDRVLADHLASSGDAEMRQESLAIYRRLYIAGNHEPEMLHNFASLLYVLDSRDTGAEVYNLWAEAYVNLSFDPNVRRGFAQYLIRNGRAKDAELVLAGKPLTEK